MYQADCSDVIGRQERRFLLKMFWDEGYNVSESVKKLKEYESVFYEESRRDVLNNELIAYSRSVLEEADRMAIESETTQTISIPARLPTMNLNNPFNSLTSDEDKRTDLAGFLTEQGMHVVRKDVGFGEMGIIAYIGSAH